MLGFIVVGNPAATVITSSPLIALSPNFGEVSVLNATKFADEPEFVVIKFLHLENLRVFFQIFIESSCSKPSIQ